MRNGVKNIVILALTFLWSLQAGSLAAQGANPLLLPHAKDLVIVKGGRLVNFAPESFLKARYTVLYFGAGWCPDCRHFSPALVAAYDHQPTDRDRFEVLLLPMDQTEDDQLKFMLSEKMKWPALAFDKMGSATDLKQHHNGKGIPWLSVVDAQGHVVLQSKDDQNAQEVLERLQELLKRKP